MLFQYLLLILIIMVTIQVIKKRKKFLDVHRLVKVSSPDIPVIGHCYKFIGTNEDRMMVMDEFSRQAYRNKYSLVSFWVLNYFVVNITDPVSASIVLRTCIDKRPISLLARHLIGNGSVFGDEEIWRLRRKILVPIFTSKYYKNFVQVFERNNKIMIEELAAVVNKGDFSMWGYFSSYALDSALDMTFGENISAQKHRSHPFLEAFEDYCKNGAARAFQPWLYSNAVYRLLPVGAKQRDNKKIIWDFIETLIHKKKSAINKDKLQNKTSKFSLCVPPTSIMAMSSAKSGNGSANSSTFLELLMEFSGGGDGYSDTELREETLVLILAAADTTATAASFAAVLLAHHPRVQRRLCHEVQKILGDSKRSVSVDDLTELKYLDAVVKESLRLYPPAPLSVRTCNRDVQLPLGMVLPEGCQVILNTRAIHRNPQRWGADADEFRPERFLTATPEQLAAFMPFGHGPRSCTGARLALASLKLSVAELTRRYRVRPAASYRYSKLTPLRVTFDVMLKHVHNFEVQLQNRC